ncbi:MAG: shikimate kinase [Dehalococcoidia bacterium]|nr:shikimate kinase [Dehalococcoidia bacterium]
MGQDASTPADVRRVVLIGFSCTGKSRVGSMLAAQLGWRLMDTDDLIVALAGKPIERIFAEDGEAHFRAVEREAVAQACAGSQRVIATGGGAPVGVENRQVLFRSSLVVALQARPETILERLQRQLAAGAVRPLLDTPDPLARIRSLLAEREPVYALANLTVETDALPPDRVATAILDHLEAAKSTETAAGE